jgi:hypothetical protein
MVAVVGSFTKQERGEEEEEEEEPARQEEKILEDRPYVDATSHFHRTKH